LDSRKAIRNVALVVVGASFAVGNFGAIAHAGSTLSRALHERKAYVHKLANIGDDRLLARQHLHHRIQTLPWMIAKARANAPTLANFRQPWNNHLSHLLGARRTLRRRLHSLERYVKHRAETLRGRRSALTAWIQTFGILRECPVHGDHVVANNFGYIVQKRPGVPRHVHLGNDITAVYGTPIVAPFNGTAVASSNTLGGLAVTVYGDGGYVYNAHLSSYGRLGAVTLGDVIGYVGATGDAGGSHDHFEWHPGNGSAVDPYPYLMAVC
jgi:murein DD-endopeptidase MepM/ murein hydrolase activator NlpD